MTDKNAVQIISGLLHNPPSAKDSANSPVAKYIQKYPYFIPTRYIKAAHQHNKNAFSEDMLAGIYPYTGNWLLLLDHLEGVQKPAVNAAEVIEEPAIEEVPEAVTDVLEVLAEDAETGEEFMAEAEIMHNEPEAPTEPEIMASVAHEPVTVTLIEEEEEATTLTEEKKDEELFLPLYSEDYFMQQGIKISTEMPDSVEELTVEQPAEDNKDKSLMVMMSFTEWLMHFKHSSEKEVSEKADQKAVRTMWQKEKLAAALEEENDEIPENVFEMAVNSIAKEDGLASESLADIYRKQGKYDQAIEMYRKLSLRNPQKNAYFARKIEEILNDKQL